MTAVNVVCIVVTFNGERWIEKCLGSVSNSNIPMHAICIDNGSTDNTTSIIQSKFPAAQLIKTGKNLGFGQANNIGLSLALTKGATHVFLLNQDAFIFEDTIQNLIAEAAANPSYGIVSPLHLNGTGSKLDNYFFRYLTESALAPFIYDILIRKSKPDVIIPTAFVNAAAWLVNSNCIKKIGGFDKTFFHYGEDRNYCQRVLHHGFKIGICTNATILHDREERIEAKVDDLSFKIKREWTHFLTIACDVNYTSPKKFIIKEFINHSAKTFASAFLLDKKQFQYHLNMTLKIPAAANKIIKSRKESLSNFGIPHL